MLNVRDYSVLKNIIKHCLRVESKTQNLTLEKFTNDLDVKEIYASYRIENKQSQRVLEKLGFKYYCELKNENYLHETFKEIAMKIEKKEL